MVQSRPPLANSLPADAMLASSLFASLDSDQESAADLPISSGSKKRKRTGTGCMAIDSVLDGGIVHGKGGVCCISGERGVGKTRVGELSFMLSSLFCRFTGIGGVSYCNMMHFLVKNRNLLLEKLGLCDLDIGLRLCVILLCPYRLRPKLSSWSSRTVQFFQKKTFF